MVTLAAQRRFLLMSQCIIPFQLIFSDPTQLGYITDSGEMGTLNDQNNDCFSKLYSSNCHFCSLNVFQEPSVPQRSRCRYLFHHRTKHSHSHITHKHCPMIHKDGGKIFYTGIRGLFKCPYVVVTDNNLSCDDTRLCVNTYTIFDD